MKKAVHYFFVFILLALSASAFGLSSDDLFQNGKTAFDMGNYSESAEIFSRFIAAWPDHKLVDDARLLRLNARSRTIAQQISTQNQELYREMSQELELLQKKFSNKDLAEATLAVQYAARGALPYSWEDLKNISNQDLNTILQHKRHPEAFSAPIQVLEFIHFRDNNNKSQSDPHLQALISYLKAQALWQMLLSPLSAEANARILKTWGDWPVHNALDQALRTGFNLGSPEIKKNVALLGFHFDCFRHKGLVKSSISSGLNSRWLTYLSERGTNLQEVWCPR